jgi:hypothetical protein
MKSTTDPACGGSDKFTGKCRGQLVCEVK